MQHRQRPLLPMMLVVVLLLLLLLLMMMMMMMMITTTMMTAQSTHRLSFGNGGDGSAPLTFLDELSKEVSEGHDVLPDARLL